jgi:DNA-binding NarL/FixJ family response regulator
MASQVIYIADNQYLSYIGLSQIFRNFYGDNATIELTPTKEILQFAIEKSIPTIIAIDYQNFDFNAISEFANIKTWAPASIILVISDIKDAKQIKDILKVGISHYIFKSSPEEDFNDALKAIQNKRKFISSELYDILLQKDRKSNDSTENTKLSLSEIEIVRFIANGKTTKEIAELKLLSFHTINTHRKNIFRKLDINNSSELIRYAINNNIITDIDYYI